MKFFKQADIISCVITELLKFIKISIQTFPDSSVQKIL